MSGSRKGISLDMTAMCDMAFLLLTFFILTAKMKTPEVVQVDTPTSISTLRLPESDIAKITISENGAVYLSVLEMATRNDIIKHLSESNNIQLSETEIKQLALHEMLGLPFNKIKGFVGLEESEKKAFEQPGIPCDSANNELKKWIISTRTTHPSIKIAIKGDIDVNYENYAKVVETLRDLNLNKFSLITDLENAPTVE